MSRKLLPWHTAGSRGKRESPLPLKALVDTVHHLHKSIEFSLSFLHSLLWSIGNAELNKWRKFILLIFVVHKYKGLLLAGVLFVLSSALYV